MGKRINDWQDTEYVLALFDKMLSNARRRYNAFVKKGIEDGHVFYFDSFSIVFRINSILARRISKSSCGIHSIGGGSSIW